MKAGRNSKLFRFLLVLCVFSSMAFSRHAFAQTANEEVKLQEGQKEGEKTGDPEFALQLGLTDQQKEQLKKLREETTAKLGPIREQAKATREELKAVMQSETIDEAKAHALVDKMTSLTGQLMHARITEVAALKQILTPEQFKKMHEKRQERKEQRRQGEGKGYLEEQEKDSGKKRHGFW